ncbi:PEP-CTERM sorting domain-containing protein [Sphingomonas sp. JC676]|nr:PEPxxWA-CTERM sorting domain-containing protein [Sphingomonas sp. JC676]MBC9032310.1 PEP-CTERM sorting domain-containing protein [Sphingomonas sp. JC676]
MVQYTDYLQSWDGGYGDLSRVIYGGGNGTSYISEIVFTPGAGKEISLNGFDAACYQNRATCQLLNYTIASLGGAAIASGSTSTLYPNHLSLAINSGWFSDGIVLRWGPDGFDAGLDNISFTVRDIVAGGVPEPSSWAMMILGFGAVGGVLRRRQTDRLVRKTALA